MRKRICKALKIKPFLSIAPLRGFAIASMLTMSATTYSNSVDTVCEQKTGSKDSYGAECHALSVNENHDDADSRELTIRVLRLPSLQESDKPPIIFIAGGPGQASSELIEGFRHQFSDLLIHHDFLFIDQRGTGKSSPLECDVNLMPYLNKSATELDALNMAFSSECLKSYEADLRFYSTPHAVRDLEKVRKHFKYSKVFLWGGSYGTRVVLEYLRAFPKAIAGTVMDGLAPVSISLPTYSARDAERALKLVLAQCENQSTCNAAFPQLEKRWKAHLETRRASPITTKLQHPRTQKEFEVYVDDLVLSAWVHLILYSREIAPILPFAMHQAIEENYGQLFSVFVLGREDMPKLISEGMQGAVLCAEDKHFYENYSDRKNKTINSSGLLKLPTRENFDKLCKLFPESNIENGYFDPPKSNTPSLFLSGEFDPVTPHSWAESLLPNFTNARHIVVPGGHHIVSKSGCMPEIIRDFFKAPKNIQILDTACADDIKPAAFFIDGSGPDLTSPFNNHATPGAQQ